MSARRFGALLIGLCIIPSVHSVTASADRPAGEPILGSAAIHVTDKAKASPAHARGLLVVNGSLHNARGSEVRIRGVNRVHWNSSSADGIARSGANAVRWAIDFRRAAKTNVDMIRSESIEHNQIPIIGNWAATCKTDTASLEAIVSIWVSQAHDWTKLNNSMIVNVANEWGPAGSTVWRDAYISAIAKLRAAGYTGPILVDSGGCGQDDGDLVQYSQAVIDSDPERNVMFSLHMYGGTNNFAGSISSISKGHRTIVRLQSDSPQHPFAASYNGTNNNYSGITAYQISGVRGMIQANGMQSALPNVGGTAGAWTVILAVDSTSWSDYTGGGTVIDYNGNYALRAARLAALSKKTGAAYIIGEFGPGKNIGPSPTMVTPGEVISAAEANGIGWLAWAWDDNDLVNCSSDNNWFDMTYHCGIYERPSDLTIFGQDVVLNPIYGLKRLAVRASSEQKHE